MKHIILLFFFNFIFFSCRNEEIESTKPKFEITVNNVTNNSISINYNIQNINSEKYLICSQSEDFDIQNYQVKIPIQSNEGTLTVSNLIANKKYYIKGWYASGYSNTITSNTKEFTFTTTTDKNLGLNPENGNFIYLMHSELDPSKSYLYIITRQIQQYPTQAKKIVLHKIDLNGNLLWSKLIQDSHSPSVSLKHNGHKIQFLSDNNIAVITGKSNQKATIITKINPINGDEIWKKEFPLIDADGYQGTTIFGYSYHNNVIKIITGPGDWHNSEEVFIDNNGNVLSQRTIIQNPNNQGVSNGKYMNDGSVVSISAQNKSSQNTLWTVEGCIRKFDFSNSTSNTLWSKYYGDYGGDDGFENYFIKNNHFYIDGFYGGNSGYSDKQHWILKTDFDGNIIWQNKLPAKQYFIYQGLDFFSDDQKNLYSLMNEIATQYNVITLTKFDENGNFIWEWSDGIGYNTDPFIANRAFEINNNEFIILGDRSTNQTGIGHIRLLRIKVD